jgi:hypothetical protein
MEQIASEKKHLTLREFLKRNTKISGGKERNVTAILKKYKMFKRVDDYITAHTDEPVSRNNKEQLPPPLDKIYVRM